MLKCIINNNEFNLCNSNIDDKELKKWSNRNILMCPVCNKPYQYCHGKVKIAYFRHKDKTECEYDYEEPETQEHLLGKMNLYNWLKNQKDIYNIVLEGYIKTTKQRPDIMFEYNNEQYVIEFQCSPISSEYYERHELYKCSNIKDIWICGISKYFQCLSKKNKRFNELEKESKIYYDSENKLFCVFEDMDKRSFSNIMKSIKDNNNYYLIKNERESCEIYSRYGNWRSFPPYGRQSNNYRYPSNVYEYDRNNSIGTKINDSEFDILRLFKEYYKE